jgi:glycosyltransferase involved in cell wall biosynthesis
MRLSAYNIFVSKRNVAIALGDAAIGNGLLAIGMDHNRLNRRYTLLPCGVNLPRPWSEMHSQQVEQLTLNQWVQNVLNTDAKHVLFAGAFDNAVKDPELAKSVIAFYNEAMGNRQWAIDEDTNSQSPIANSPTLCVIHQENMGLSEARNTGTQAAQGDYIMYVDSDDYLQSNMLGALMDQVERDQLDVLRFRYQNVRESGEVFVPHEGMKTDYNNYSPIPTDGLTFLNDRMWVQCYVVQFLVKSEIVRQELFTPGIYFEDTDWTPRMLLRAKRVASIDLVVYNYLWREGSITLSQKDITKMRKQLHDKLILIEKLNTLANSVTCRRWFDGMISGLVINVVGIIASTFYDERKQYIKQIKMFGVLPLKNINVAPRAVKKLRLINLSINLATWILHKR